MTDIRNPLCYVNPVQRSHLTLLAQALRQHNAIMAATAGAMAGCAAFFGWASDVPFWYGLFAIGGGLFAWVFNREAGVFLLFCGVFFGLAGLQVDRLARAADPVASAFDSSAPLVQPAAGEGATEKAGAPLVAPPPAAQALADPSRVWQIAARKPHWVVGRLKEIVKDDQKQNRSVLVIEDVRIYNLPGLDSAKRVRANVFASQTKELAIGEGVAVPMFISPPKGPRAPGERDTRIWRMAPPEELYGYARGTVEPTYLKPAKAAPPQGRVQGMVDGLREGIRFAASPYAGGVVAALLMGDQRGIPPDIRDAYRLTGLTHLIAISGMQLTLVGGGLFFMLRWLAAFFPALVLRYNIKALAAVAGLAAAAFYTLLAGAGVGVVRAFIMTALVMMAAITGRLSVALRAWCLAGLLVLALNPMAILQAGFQLSMAAVLALLLWGLTVPDGAKGPRAWLRELALASIVAGAATAPLLVLNFGQLSAVALLANLGAVPLMTLATYLGMLALLLWPLGLQGPVLALMGFVVGWVNDWALWLSAWQGSVAIDPRWWWLLLVLGVLTIAAVVLRHWWGVVASVFAAMALAWGLALWQPPADVLVLDGGKAGLVREGAGLHALRFPVYYLAWAENPRGALWLAEKTGLPVTVDDGSAREAVPGLLPPLAPPGTYAWAARYGQDWRITPVTCARVWQRIDQRCWKKPRWWHPKPTEKLAGLR